MNRALPFPLLLCAVLLLGLPASASAQNVRDFSIKLISQTPQGNTPNAPATNPAISADERLNTIIAYQSAATNITRGTRPGVQNVFAVRRRGRMGRRGTPWHVGPTFLVSRGVDGQPADGPSYKPAVSGWSKGLPRCIAFISRATNLVRGNPGPFAQAYLYRWSRNPSQGRIELVSRDPFGRPGDGDVVDVDVDGDCTNVVFSSQARNLALNSLRGVPSSRRAEWRSSLSFTPPEGTTSVYVRRLGQSEHSRRALVGITSLVSRTGRHGVRRGDNVEVQISHARTRTVVYTNRRGANSIIYGTRLSTGPRIRGIRYNTARLSGSRRASNPDVGESGLRFAWQRARGDRNEVVRAAIRRGRLRRGRISPNGQNPSQTSAGTWIFFDTIAALQRRGTPDTNNVHDIYLHTAANRRNRLVSVNRGLTLLRHPSRNPAASARGNYVLFEHRRGIIMKYLGPQ